MKNQSILLFLSILITFSFTSCKNFSENEMHLKDMAILELDNQTSKIEVTKSDYYYGIGSRFEAISKTDLENATTIYPFNRDKENERIAKVNSTEIIIIENNQQSDIREYGDSEKLSEAQKTLFKSLGYAKHFIIKTNFQEKTNDRLNSEEKKYSPHYTIVPETEATYKEGDAALINYLIENSKAETANLDDKKLGSTKIYFTVTKNGEIENVLTDFSTGYLKLDAKLKELISKIPGEWLPAKNAKGEKMEQELTFTFGPKGRC